MSSVTLPVVALHPATDARSDSFLQRWARWWVAFSSAWQGGLDAPRREPVPRGAGRQPGRLVARTWHGRVPREKADAYEEFLARTGLADYAGTPGHRDMLALRRDEGDETHFLLLTLWESREAIAGFAGDDIEAARYYPEDRDYLLEFEPRVTHYDVFAGR